MFVVDDAAAAIRDYATQGYIGDRSRLAYGSSLQKLHPISPTPALPGAQLLIHSASQYIRL